MQALLKANVDALRMLPLFEPGFAADALDDLLWERNHGQSKRVRIIAETLVRAGWAAQSAYHGTPADAPKITEDVAMFLVNQELAEYNVTCAREDIRAAISYLASGLAR